MQVKQPSVVYTNQTIAVGKDLVFTWVILTENGWMPIDKSLGVEILKLLEDNVRDAIFPLEVKNWVADALTQAENEVA